MVTRLVAAFFATVGAFSNVLVIVFTLCSGAWLAAPLDGIRQHEHVEASKQQQEERGQRQVDYPCGRISQSHLDEVGDDG